MKLFFTATQLAHQPKQYMVHGKIVDPFENPNRATTLITSLESVGLERAEPKDYGRAPILKVHAGHYVAFLEEAYARFMELPNHGPEVLPNVHPYRGASLAYADRGPPRVTGIIGRAGWYMGDMSCATMEGTFRAATPPRRRQSRVPRTFCRVRPRPFRCAVRRGITPTPTAARDSATSTTRPLPPRCCDVNFRASPSSISTPTTATARRRSFIIATTCSTAPCTPTRPPTIPTSPAMPTKQARAQARART